MKASSQKVQRRRRELRAVMSLFFDARPGMAALGAALAAATVLMGMALLGLSGWFIAATAIAGLQPATAIMFDVFMPSAGIRLLAIGRTATRYFERLTTHDATLGVTADLRERLFRGWAQPQAAYRLLARPARLLFRLTGDIDALESLYLRVFVPAIAAAAAALAAGIVFGIADAWMGVAMLAWLVGTGLAITLLTARRVRRASVQRGLALEAVRSRTVDLVAGQTELIMAARLQAQCESLATADARLASADARINKLETAAGFMHGAVGAITLSAALLAAGWLVEHGRIDVPVAALLLLVALTAAEPFAALRRGAVEAGRTWLAIRRIAPRIEASAPEAAPPALPQPGRAVELADVSLAHSGSSVPVVTQCSLQIDAADCVALIGPSGAGKSTLMAAIAGELAPHAGSVSAWPCCWLTQRTELFQDSLRGNLLVANPAADDDELWSALDAAGLSEDVRNLSAQLDTRLGEGGLGLSGGQSRRLALARMFLRGKRGGTIWLLDEPTEGLDTLTARDVLDRLQIQAFGHTVIIATHLRREATLANRLLRVDEGVLVADLRRGTPQFEAALDALRQD